jgi:1,4-dihydroxy-2-naphthoyl-CoA hydrolase
MTAPSQDSPESAPDVTDAAHWKITLGELDEKMGVKIVEESVQRVVATMPVEGNRQSFGLLHGGASLAVGEAVGSWAAVIHASTLGKTAVGVDVSATHHRSAREGQITITATPIHLGGTLTTHEVLITDGAGQRLCTMRITNLLMTPKNQSRFPTM